MTILGRYSFSPCSNNIKIESCCSILEQLSSKGFLRNMLLTFESFINGFRKISESRNQSELKYYTQNKLNYIDYSRKCLYTNCRNDWNNIL